MKLRPSILGAGFLLLAWALPAQVALVPGGSRLQDFNALGSASATWVDNTNLPGWYASVSNSDGTVGPYTSAYTVTAGGATASSTTLFALGAANSAERCLGGAPATTRFGMLGWRLVNGSGTVITNLVVTYDGEQWRRDTSANSKISVSYKVFAPGSGSLSSLGGWTAAPDSLTFTAPTTGPAGSLDGNEPTNRAAGLTATLTGLSLQPNDELWLKWTLFKIAGANIFLGIDNVTVAVPGPAPATNQLPFDVYLASGQSNMDGRGSASDLTGDLAGWSQPQSDVRIYYANPVNLDATNPTYNTGWQVMGPGFSVPPGFSGALPSGTFGPELAFARAVADANTNRRVAIIKVSQGGTSLSSDWKPASGYMYATLTNMTRVALQGLTNSGVPCTLRGMIWHQGESDGTSSTATYQTRLTEFIAAVRNDLGVSNLPFVVGELATNRSLTVRQAQMNVAESVPYVGFASSSNLVTLAPDDPHFTAPGVLVMGQRMAAALESPPVRFTEIHGAGASLSLTAAGLACSTCRLLMATNLSLPLGQWRAVATNTFDAGGQVTFSAAADTGSGTGLQFYTISAE
jgi:hypothetical protein